MRARDDESLLSRVNDEENHPLTRRRRAPSAEHRPQTSRKCWDFAIGNLLLFVVIAFATWLVSPGLFRDTKDDNGEPDVVVAGRVATGTENKSEVSRPSGLWASVSEDDVSRGEEDGEALNEKIELENVPMVEPVVRKQHPTANLKATVTRSPDSVSVVPNTIIEENDGGDYDEEVEYSQVDQTERKKLQDDWASQKFATWEEELNWKAERCRTRMASMSSLSPRGRRLLDADCGLGYNLTASPARTKPWRVVFYATKHNGMMLFTGCPSGGKGRCPLSPECSTIATDNPAILDTADVVVVFQKEPRKILDVKYDNVTHRPYRVSLWREAVWRGPHIPLQKESYDFEIGTHHTAGIPNPQWFLAPSDLLSGRLFTSEKLEFIPLHKRNRFAISIISHCDAPSLRDFYLANLIDALGKNLVHRFGACGTRKLPPRPISNAVKLIAKYKFFLSFENTIQEGYVTEKLLETLALPILPVYFGAPNVPNITSTPSFIKASDFSSPAELAKYLKYLDANPAEYNKYHVWRKQENPFDEYYLNLMKNRIAGPLEVEAHSQIEMKDNLHDELNYQFRQRRAQCCRLCDAKYVEKLRLARKELVPEPWDEDKINNYFFEGKMYGDKDQYKKGKPLEGK